MIRTVLKWIGIVLLALLGWAALMLVEILWTGDPLQAPALLVTLGIVVVVVWLATTGRLGWLFKKGG